MKYLAVLSVALLLVIVNGYPYEQEDHHRERRQLFGGRTGGSQTFGYQAGPAWGSISQASPSSPISYNAGAGYTSPGGHGISGSVSHIPSLGSQASVRGQVGLFNNPSHQVSAWAQHDRNFDRSLRPLGPETNSAGVNYINKNNGASAFLSGSNTPGFPKTGSVGGNFPIATGNGGRTRLDLNGQTNFGQGMKPQHQVGATLSHNF